MKQGTAMVKLVRLIATVGGNWASKFDGTANKGRQVSIRWGMVLANTCKFFH